MPIPSKPNFKGQITYLPGPWGLMPVTDARVRIYDKDISGEDLLIDVKTDGQGRFSAKATREWRDEVSVRLPLGGHRTILDVTDIPVFVAKIDDPATQKDITLPFAYLGDAVSTPLAVPWSPPREVAEAVILINDKWVATSDSPAAVWESIKDLVEARERVTLRFAGVLRLMYDSLLSADYPAVRGRLCKLLNLDQDSTVLAVNPAAETLLAIAVILGVILIGAPVAIGAGTFGVCCGLAVMLAVHMGYTVSVEDAQTVETAGGVPIPLSDRVIVLNPPSS